MMLLALMLTMMGSSSVMAKIYQAELDKSMFKAWTDHQPGASVVEEPAAIDNGAATFNCEANFFKQLEGGNVVFGNTNVYYLWYADLTGTQEFAFKGTPGLVLRVLMNRPEPVEGGDAHGGATVEKQVTIGDNGEATLDVSDLEYVHLNCIKVNWGGSGIVKEITIKGTVKPVTGILSMINNGDAEGDDLESFPVSYDGPNNDNTANERPEVVAGGVSGKCFKVSTYPDPTETWHTQFYIKSDEVLAKGTKWKLNMSIKADRDCSVTTSAQAQPRTWKGGMGIDEFGVGTEWKNYTWSGEIGVDDFQSIAFDLNNEGGSPGNASNTFYFDNIEFGIDLGGTNPMNDIVVTAGSDVICVNFNGNTNIASLVRDYGVNTDAGRTVIFDNSCAKVSIGGEDQPIVSVEGRENGNLYIFLDDDAELVEDDETDVKVAFTNPTDANRRLLFTTGKWEGQAVPDFSGISAEYDEELGVGDIYSYMWGAPALVTIEPEAGSFNLPADFKEFKVTFNQDVKAESIVAKLGTEPLTVSPAEGLAKVFTLTRTAATEIKGAVEFVISEATGAKKASLQDPIAIMYSYGPVSADAQPETLFTDNFGADGKNNYVPAGWVINSDGEEREAGDYGSGCRIIVGGGGDNGFTNAIAYICSRGVSGDVEVPGRAYYGAQEGYQITLTPRKYTLTLGAARWDSDGTERQLKVQVCDEAGEVIVEETKAVVPAYKGSKDATRFSIEFEVEETTNVVLKFIPLGMNGEPNGYGDACAVGDIKLQFIPDVLGIIESQALADALQSAKETYEELAIADEDRYAGEDLTALNNLIQEVEAGKASYFAPSVYTAKTAELAAAAKAANDHKAACDTYDTNITKLVDIINAKAETKFKNTELFGTLQALAATYNASSQTTNLGTEEEPLWETNYVFNKLTDNAALTEANTALTNAVKLGEQFFTEVALDADIQQGNCGIAVLTERVRLGARALLALGVDAEDPIFDAVKNALTDDDQLAEDIKARIKVELYKQMADPNNTLFQPEEGKEEFDNNGQIIPRYHDMTVFLKNPNIYGIDGPVGITEENVPGWTYPEGYGKPGSFTAWSARNVNGLPEDYAFTTWFGTCRMEQTITDLPVGLYIVSLCGSDWSNQANVDRTDGTEPHDVNGFVYCKTSDTPAVEEGEEEDRDLNFAATRTIVYGGQYNMDHAHKLGVEELINEETGFIDNYNDGETIGIPVIDGKLTLGIHFAGDAQYFFQHARLTLIAPAEGYDYAAAYQEAVASVDTPVAPKVRAMQVYDLNGRRMIRAQKGIQIVKKQMSDGTVRVEKVIVK